MMIASIHEAVSENPVERKFYVITNDVSTTAMDLHETEEFPAVGSHHKKLGIVRNIDYSRIGKFQWVVTVGYEGKPEQCGRGNAKCQYCGRLGVFGESCKGCGAC